MATPLRAEASRGGERSRYRVFAPAIAGAVVACTWEGIAGWDRELRLLPDGCVDLVFDGERVSARAARAAPLRIAVRGEAHNVGVRIRPGAGRAVLGRRVDALPDAGLALAELWGAAATARAEARLHAAGPDARTVLADLAAAAAGLVDPAVVAAARALLARPDATVAHVAAAVGLTPRELRRRFAADVGFGPKRLARVARFQRVLRALDAVATDTITLAGLAAAAGYADQAHLTRECRALSGSSPAALAETFKTAAPRPVTLQR